jgi:hypothetical protein
MLTISTAKQIRNVVKICHAALGKCKQLLKKTGKARNIYYKFDLQTLNRFFLNCIVLQVDIFIAKGFLASPRKF